MRASLFALQQRQSTWNLRPTYHLKRFVGRRGYPLDVHSDNGSNFRGAWREIKEVQDLLRREETQSAIRHFSSERAIKSHFSPAGHHILVASGRPL